MRDGEFVRRRLGAVLMVCLLSWAVSAQGGSIPPPGLIPLDPPRPAPALALSDMDGVRYRLEDDRGEWVFVHFWASWCGPCRREMPTIQRLAEQSPLPMKIVLVNTAEIDDVVFNFLGGVAPDLETLMDYEGTVTGLWDPHGLPATFLVDPGGVIRFRALGGRPWDEPPYRAFLQSLATGQ